MCAATHLESERRGFAFFTETNLSACRFGRQITLSYRIVTAALEVLRQQPKQKFAFNFPIVLRPIADLHKVSMLNAMDLLSRLSRIKPSLFHPEGGSEDQLLSGTTKSRGCTIAAERKSNDLGI